MFHFDTHGKYTVTQIPNSTVIGQMIVEESAKKAWFVGASRKRLILDATKLWYNRIRTGNHASLQPVVFQFDSDPSTYLTSDWTTWVESIGVRRQYAPPAAHQSHGVAERHIGVAQSMAFAMLHYSRRGKTFMFLAMRFSVLIRNFLWQSSTADIPESAWTGKMIDHGLFKIFGCDAYSKIDDRPSKLDFKADRGIFVGLDTYSYGYLIYYPSTKQILVRRDVVFDQRWLKDFEIAPVFPSNLDRIEDVVETRHEEPPPEESRPDRITMLPSR